MWDDQIDEVARALTSGPSPARLTARVMAAIRHDARPARAWRRWWMLSPVAVAAMIAIAAVLRGGWSAPRLQAPPQPASRDITLPAAARLAETHAPAAPPTAVVGRAPVARAAPQPGPGDRTTGVDIEQLTVERLGVQRAQLSRIAPPETIELKALEVVPLATAPLTRDERQPPH